MTDRWTDDELDDDFEAAMLGVEPGQPGPGMAESDRLVRTCVSCGVAWPAPDGHKSTCAYFPRPNHPGVKDDV